VINGVIVNRNGTHAQDNRHRYVLNSTYCNSAFHVLTPMPPVTIACALFADEFALVVFGGNPLLSAAAVCSAFRMSAALCPLARLVVGCAFDGTYPWMLLYGNGQKAFDVDLLRGLRCRAALGA
jgi:hypothetical protein